ncbi:hypothetical protein [Paraburkholderia sp. MM5384-R2]|uniref:hypothetical protein n=1 Tax=Paraburkholderia sp. MM5384-R2 TaxID=2723097 RepID=UPI0016156C9E|nr:hypothetical protein [Paraburkholderia sp. MM5384-R2]MBB5498742.1 hypothetical protein [Paraburkholderia sp. MM5384-R2]
MKNLVYERAISADVEQVGIRLYQVPSGFIAERYLIQGDELMLVQILPVSSKDEFEKFALSDPHHSAMRVIYMEVRNIVWEGGVGKVI